MAVPCFISPWVIEANRISSSCPRIPRAPGRPEISSMPLAHNCIFSVERAEIASFSPRWLHGIVEHRQRRGDMFVSDRPGLMDEALKVSGPL